MALLTAGWPTGSLNQITQPEPDNRMPRRVHGRPAGSTYWTKDRIRDAIWRFHTEHKRWPTTFDFAPQVRVSYLPHFCTLWRIYHTLEAAILAAQQSSGG